ncbi:acyltransferase [Chitinophagaceae bacterium LB-8]|uniref:Acyltransferase n=1 Tax=Paraflavisolibacter caeni TaxID=2982496 RepID=A0A9X3B6N9_9BACT|nr:acyltransferase [Paraflavisolibacter caeni]MCU7547506.1 acyltransferase [Paraflavisolibacter caeni]
MVKLEAVRGFAAVYVVLHHIFSKELSIGGNDISFLFSFGQEAVILFFMLSGFVIQYAYSYSKDKSFRTFFLKRLLRIYFPLIIVFIAHYVLSSISLNGFRPINWWTFWGNIFMLQDISFLKPNVICEPFLGNSPLWSLSYEWWFYMLFFFLVNKLKERSSAVVYIIGAIAALTYLVHPNFLNRVLMYLVIWWAGVDMAKLYLNKVEITVKNLKTPLVIMVLHVFILILNVVLHKNSSFSIGVSPFLELRHFSFAIISILLAILWKKMKWVGFKQTLGIFEPVAPISFGIYISHWFLIIQADYLDTIISNELCRLCVYSFVCILFSYFIECLIFKRFSNCILNKINIINVESSCASFQTTNLPFNSLRQVG